MSFGSGNLDRSCFKNSTYSISDHDFSWWIPAGANTYLFTYLKNTLLIQCYSLIIAFIALELAIASILDSNPLAEE
ncbi:MAG: hypothetical protein HEQ35_11800 [Gloeotrichia echinulata IR180]